MDDPKLQDYIAVIRRRRRVVLAALLVSLAAAAAISFLQTPRYRAEAELMLRPSMSEQLLVDRAGQVRSARESERELNNEIERIESQSVRDAVAERYDGPLDVDDVEADAPASESTDVVLVHVTATDRAAAAELVNLYAETYVEVRRQSQIDELLAASEDIQSRLDSLREEIAEASQPLDAGAPPAEDRRPPPRLGGHPAPARPPAGGDRRGQPAARRHHPPDRRAAGRQPGARPPRGPARHRPAGGPPPALAAAEPRGL